MIKAYISRKTRKLELLGSPLTLLTDSVLLSLAVINEAASKMQMDASEIMGAYIKSMKDSLNDEILIEDEVKANE